MRQIFKSTNFFTIPDGTFLSPFLNAKDTMNDLPFELMEGFSIAMGKIVKWTNSKIHVHPQVVQETFVLSNKIKLKMKGENDTEPYAVELQKNEACITGKGEFFQLENPYDDDCLVLYIVSPDYLFEMVDNKVFYDDAIILSQNWDELKAINWLPKELNDAEILLNPGTMHIKELKSKRVKYQKCNKI